MDTPHKDNECERQIMATVHEEENQKRNLKSEFAAWRRKIKPLYEILGRKPEPEDPEFERLIFCDLNNDDSAGESIDERVIWKCQEVYDHLLKQVDSRKAEAISLWSEVQNMWKEVEEAEELGLCFTNAEAGIVKMLKELKSQYCSRKVDKSRRLQEFICELRTEISEIWDLCLITDEERKEFIEYNSCEFTEDMLRIHKEELQKWKIYLKKNQEILQKIHKRDTMWKKLRELEAKASDPSRFVNRGGSLLKDQNMHNYVKKTLPKLEQELISLAQKFETEHGKKMKILGEEIPAMIEKDWQLFKQEFSKKNSRTAPSPTKPMLQTIRRSIAPPSTANPQLPQIRPLEKRFGSKLDLSSVPPATKRSKLQPLKPIQGD